MKKWVLNLLLAVVLLCGAGLLAYPTVSNWWNQMHQSRAIAGYDQAVRDIPQEDYTELIEAARRYNNTLRMSGAQDFQTGDAAYAEYEALLDPSGSGIMGYVIIPKINVELPVYHGTEDNVLQVAVGHLYGSSLPVGGKGTHACLSGHTGLPRATLFTDLTELDEGDMFCVRTLNEELYYKVDQIKVVLPTDVSDLQIDPEQDYCTLITCTPYGVNSHRLLVRGVRTEAPKENDSNFDGSFDVVHRDDGYSLKDILAFVLLIIIGIGVVVFIINVIIGLIRRATGYYDDDEDEDGEYEDDEDEEEDPDDE